MQAAHFTAATPSGQHATEAIGNADAVAMQKPFFRLTGYVGALVDLPRRSTTGLVVGPSADGIEQCLETAVVEVKHRMGRTRIHPRSTTLCN